MQNDHFIVVLTHPMPHEHGHETFVRRLGEKGVLAIAAALGVRALTLVRKREQATTFDIWEACEVASALLTDKRIVSARISIMQVDAPVRPTQGKKPTHTVVVEDRYTEERMQVTPYEADRLREAGVTYWCDECRVYHPVNDMDSVRLFLSELPRN